MQNMPRHTGQLHEESYKHIPLLLSECVSSHGAREIRKMMICLLLQQRHNFLNNSFHNINNCLLFLLMNQSVLYHLKTKSFWLQLGIQKKVQLIHSKAKDHDLSHTGEDLWQGVKSGSKTTPTPPQLVGVSVQGQDLG